jgi:hypothetical protein
MKEFSEGQEYEVKVIYSNVLVLKITKRSETRLHIRHNVP